MNERILELALQAGFHPPVVKRMGDEYKFEKFAELVVRECVNVMSHTAKEANDNFTYLGDDVPTVVHQSKIKQHFGVEE